MMGREIKRVALDFDWPMGVQWKGYMDPYQSQKCRLCDGSGLNPETKKIADDFYDFERAGTRWIDKITQDEVDALIEQGRLRDFTHEFIPGEGWKPREDGPVTADMVNTVNQRGGLMGHDAINRWILIKTRAKRLGVFGECPLCEDGVIWFSDRIKELAERWYEDERYDPPAGEGWQVWETVSEGSAVTPVLPTREALIEYLVKHGDLWDQKRGDGGWSQEAAEQFVGHGHAMSLVSVGGKVYSPRDGVPA